MLNTCRLIVLLLSCLLLSSAFAQKVTNIKRGTADFKAIVAVVTPYANANAAHPVRVKGDVIRRSGDWVFVRSQMSFLNPKHQGDGELMAILKKGRRWTIREITLGSGGMEDLATAWEKKHKLPKGLIPRMISD